MTYPQALFLSAARDNYPDKNLEKFQKIFQEKTHSIEREPLFYTYVCCPILIQYLIQYWLGFRTTIGPLSS